MIPYKLPEERQTLQHYANLLNDQAAKNVFEHDALHSKEEAEHFARFFWRMVRASNAEDKKAA